MNQSMEEQEHHIFNKLSVHVLNPYLEHHLLKEKKAIPTSKTW